MTLKELVQEIESQYVPYKQADTINWFRIMYVWKRIPDLLAAVKATFPVQQDTSPTEAPVSSDTVAHHPV